MSVEKGLILFSIEKDNCLNGVYANELREAGDKVRNLIAVKNPETGGIPRPGFAGTYALLYFNYPGIAKDGTMIIEGGPFHYKLKINTDGGSPRFVGDGYQMNSHQLVFRYQHA